MELLNVEGRAFYGERAHFQQNGTAGAAISRRYLLPVEKNGKFIVKKLIIAR